MSSFEPVINYGDLISDQVISKDTARANPFNSQYMGNGPEAAVLDEFSNPIFYSGSYNDQQLNNLLEVAEHDAKKHQ